MTEVRIKSVFKGSDADYGRIDLYDGSESLTGLSRAMTLIARAYATRKAVSRTFQIKGVKLFREAPRYGSFIDGIRIVIDDDIFPGTNARDFFRLVEWCFNEAVGNVVDDIDGALNVRMRSAADQLVAAVEEPIKRMHRPITRDEGLTLSIQRTQGAELITYDKYSAMRFQEHIATETTPLVGSVTRFNSLSRWGRIYSEEHERTISFLLSRDMSTAQRARVTKSLSQFDKGHSAEIILHSRLVTVAENRLKRLLVERVTLLPN